MALIKCPNCQKDVSSMVPRCPFCNTDLTHRNSSDSRDTVYYKPDSDSIYYPEFPERSDKASGTPFDTGSNRNPDSEPEYRTDSRPERQANPRPERQADSGSAGKNRENSKEKSASAARKRKKFPPPAGRRLLGYRKGNPFYMFVSVLFHMAACVGILYAFSLSPQYWGSSALLFHIIRVIAAAMMLFLPVLLLSENKLRRKFPVLRSRKPAAVITGLLILYIPLAVLFSLSWYFCL